MWALSPETHEGGTNVRQLFVLVMRFDQSDLSHRWVVQTYSQCFVGKCSLISCWKHAHGVDALSATLIAIYSRFRLHLMRSRRFHDCMPRHSESLLAFAVMHELLPVASNRALRSRHADTETNVRRAHRGFARACVSYGKCVRSQLRMDPWSKKQVTGPKQGADEKA